MNKIYSTLAFLVIILAGCGAKEINMPNADVCGLGEGCLASTAEYGYNVGDVMPDTTLTDIEGNEYQLYDLMEGKDKVILSLEASWCDDCHRQDVKYNQFYENLPDNVLYLPIYTSYSKEDDPEKQANLETTKAYLNDKGYEYKAYYDTNDKLWKKFQAKGTPTNIVLDKNARIKAISLEYDSDILLLKNTEDLEYPIITK